jgi:hypothetical protein
VLLKNVAEGAYEVRVCVSVEAFYEHVGAGWCGVVHDVPGAVAVLGECIIGVRVLDLERWVVEGELGWGRCVSLGGDERDG